MGPATKPCQNQQSWWNIIPNIVINLCMACLHRCKHKTFQIMGIQTWGWTFNWRMVYVEMAFNFLPPMTRNQFRPWLTWHSSKMRNPRFRPLQAPCAVCHELSWLFLNLIRFCNVWTLLIADSGCSSRFSPQLWWYHDLPVSHIPHFDGSTLVKSFKSFVFDAWTPKFSSLKSHQTDRHGSPVLLWENTNFWTSPKITPHKSPIPTLLQKTLENLFPKSHRSLPHLQHLGEPRLRATANIASAPHSSGSVGVARRTAAAPGCRRRRPADHPGWWL